MRASTCCLSVECATVWLTVAERELVAHHPLHPAAGAERQVGGVARRQHVEALMDPSALEVEHVNVGTHARLEGAAVEESLAVQCHSLSGAWS